MLGAESLSAAKNYLTFCAVRLFITVGTTACPLSYPVPNEASLLPPVIFLWSFYITFQLYRPSGICHLVSPLSPSDGWSHVQFWQGQQIFLFSRPSIPVLRPIQPHIQWVTEVVSGGKCGRGVKLTTRLQLLTKLRNSGDIVVSFLLGKSPASVYYCIPTFRNSLWVPSSKAMVVFYHCLRRWNR